MTRENVVLIHWHDLGRHLELYGAAGAHAPGLDRLAAESVVFDRAHAAAPLCSPSRGALLTGRHPHDNGIVGLAHHGWEYLPGVRTLPAVLAEHGWDTVLYGMQHESADPGSLGYGLYDVSDSDCDVVTANAVDWLAARAPGDGPFLLNAGFFEVHRPYPETRYPPGDPAAIVVPEHLPDTPEVRADLASFHSSIVVADAATARLVDALDASGHGDDTWLVFFTDHGAAFPGAKSTLYDRGTGISLIVRPPARLRGAGRRHGGLFSGVDLLPTVLDVLGLPIPGGVQGVSHAAVFAGEDRPVRDAVFTQKNYHDSYDPIRAVRTEHHSYVENFAARRRLELPLDIADSAPGRAFGPEIHEPRAPVELYDLVRDPGETTNLADHPDYAGVRATLAARLARWRVETRDVVTPDEEGTAIAEEFMRAYLAGLRGEQTVPRSPRGADRQLRGGRRGRGEARVKARPKAAVKT